MGESGSKESAASMDSKSNPKSHLSASADEPRHPKKEASGYNAYIVFYFTPVSSPHLFTQS